MELTFYLRELWDDDRLKFDPDMFSGARQIHLSEEAKKRIWLPDTFIANSIKSENPDANSISHRSFVRVRHTGEVYSSRRLVTANFVGMSGTWGNARENEILD